MTRTLGQTDPVMIDQAKTDTHNGASGPIGLGIRVKSDLGFFLERPLSIKPDKKMDNIFRCLNCYKITHFNAISIFTVGGILLLIRNWKLKLNLLFTRIICYSS